MKEELEGLAVFLGDLVKQYGFTIAVFVFLYFSIRKAFFWLIMPILFITTTNTVGYIFDSDTLSKISTISRFDMLITWIFVFMLLKYIAGLFFEV